MGNCGSVIKGFYKKHKALIVFGILSIIIGCSGLLFYAILFERNDIEIHDVWIHNSGLENILGDKLVVQLSDLHIGAIGVREEKILNLLNQMNPDIIFLTGDYVPWKRDYNPALKYLSQLKAKIGIWAVMGDYDYSNSRKSCLFCHVEGTGQPAASHKVRFLRDASEVLRLSAGSVSLAGIDGEDADESDVTKTFASVNNDLPIIVLCHNPLLFDQLPDDRHILMLSGDTHGGQVPLPGWVFAILGYKKNALYNQGLFERGKKKMFVSRGIGWSHLPIRIFRKPEVAVLHFTQ